MERVSGWSVGAEAVRRTVLWRRVLARAAAPLVIVQVALALALALVAPAIGDAERDVRPLEWVVAVSALSAFAVTAALLFCVTAVALERAQAAERAPVRASLRIVRERLTRVGVTIAVVIVAGGGVMAAAALLAGVIPVPALAMALLFATACAVAGFGPLALVVAALEGASGVAAVKRAGALSRRFLFAPLELGLLMGLALIALRAAARALELAADALVGTAPAAVAAPVAAVAGAAPYLNGFILVAFAATAFVVLLERLSVFEGAGEARPLEAYVADPSAGPEHERSSQGR